MSSAELSKVAEADFPTRFGQHESVIQTAVRDAVLQAGLVKPASSPLDRLRTGPAREGRGIMRTERSA